MPVATDRKVGKVVQVIGPVVDIEFEGGHLPEIYHAIRVKGGTGASAIDVIVEVEQHLGENRVRTVAMKPTDGMQRGMEAVDTGEGITMPVGPATLGRVMNVLGEPVDFPDRPVKSKERWATCLKILLQLEDMTFSTSGDYERSLVKDGKRYHHILDPRTGYPAEGPRGVTLIGDDLDLVNGFSAAIMAMGEARGRALLEQYLNLEGVIFNRDGTVWVSPALVRNHKFERLDEAKPATVARD